MSVWRYASSGDLCVYVLRRKKKKDIKFIRLLDNLTVLGRQKMEFRL